MLRIRPRMRLRTSFKAMQCLGLEEEGTSSEARDSTVEVEEEVDNIINSNHTGSSTASSSTASSSTVSKISSMDNRTDSSNSTASKLNTDKHNRTDSSSMASNNSRTDRPHSSPRPATMRPTWTPALLLLVS